MNLMKKMMIFAVVVVSCGSMLGLGRSKITFIGRKDSPNKLAEKVTIKMWRAANFFSPAILDKLNNPYKTFTLKPGKKVTVVIPEGRYWIQVFGEEGSPLTKTGGLVSHGLQAVEAGATYKIEVGEQTTGIFGQSTKAVLLSSDLDLIEKSGALTEEGDQK